jgi:hypothetical protein
VRVADPATHYELGKLRALHDKWINHAYRTRGLYEIMSAETLVMDREVEYHIDALEALIEYDAPEETA